MYWFDSSWFAANWTVSHWFAGSANVQQTTGGDEYRMSASSDGDEYRPWHGGVNG